MRTLILLNSVAMSALPKQGRALIVACLYQETCKEKVRIDAFILAWKAPPAPSKQNAR